MTQSKRSGETRDDGAADEEERPARERFETEYARALPRIVAWGRLRFSGRAGFEVDDLVQETWARAFGAYPRFDPACSSFPNWLFGIAQKVMLEWVRRDARERRVRPAREKSDILSKCPDSMTSISRALARDERVGLLVQAIDALPPEDRQLVLLRGIEERPFAEVGTVLGIEPDAAAKRWERLRARLQSLPDVARVLGD